MYIKKTSKESGFTLVELAVVLVIISLLVGSFIGSFSGRIDATRREATKKELAEIKQVLLAYVYVNGTPLALPCPDTDVPPDGVGNGVAGVCAAGTAVGTLPWVTLGMGRQDAWGTQYSYWVQSSYANNIAGFNLDTPSGGGEIDTRVNNIARAIAPNAVAVIFSRGKNGLGGISSEGVSRDVIPAAGNGHDDELANADNDEVFMSRFNTDEGVTAAGGAFDDILIWINTYEIKAKMVEAGKLPLP